MQKDKKENTKDSFLQYLSLSGEVLVLIGAALWIVYKDFPQYIFCAGAVLMTIGRFCCKIDSESLTLKRLYIQRLFGTIMCLVAAVLMYVAPIFLYGVYIQRQTWLLPFLVFGVLEVYTSFRIPYLENKECSKH